MLTNKDLETMVETTDQWILERTGIRERHMVDKGVAASDLAVEAVKKLLESHPFDLQEVDLIVVGTVTPDMMYPSTACLVQHKLGHRAHVGLRCLGGLLGLRLCAEHGREVHRIGTVQESAGDRLRREFVDDRLTLIARFASFSATAREQCCLSRPKKAKTESSIM